MYILKYIDLKNDEVLNSKPICIRNDNNTEINCLGILVQREIIHLDLEGHNYYQFVYFYGKSPMNFNRWDFKKLEKEYSLDTSLEIVVDFRHSYSEYSDISCTSTLIQFMQVTPALHL